MRHFYETYHGHEILSPLVREISWTKNLVILERCSEDDEREFYLRSRSMRRFFQGFLDYFSAKTRKAATLNDPPNPRIDPVTGFDWFDAQRGQVFEAPDGRTGRLLTFTFDLEGDPVLQFSPRDVRAFSTSELKRRADLDRTLRLDSVDITAHLKHETEKEFLLDDGLGNEIWVPKAAVGRNEDGTFSMPEWLAKKRGLI
jgi:hypothetical protein